MQVLNNARKSIYTIIIVYISLALFLTIKGFYPSQNSLWIIGDETTDIWDHYWGHHRTLQYLKNGSLPPFAVNELKYPQGGTYFWIDTWNTIVMLLPAFIIPLPLLYNFIIFLNFFLSALSAYILVYYLTGSFSGAASAGLIYGFSPFIISSAANGISEQTPLYLLPLYILALFKSGNALQEKFQFRRYLSLIKYPIIRFALNLIASLYSAPALILFSTVFFLCAKYRNFKNEKSFSGYPIITLIVITAAGCLLAMPYIALFIHAHDAPDALTDVRFSRVDMESTFLSHHSDLLYSILPVQGGKRFQYYPMGYLGIVPFVLTVLFVIFFKNCRKPEWIFPGILAFLFSMGSYATWNGELFYIGDYIIKMPYKILLHITKFIGIGAAFPVKFQLLSILSMACIIGSGLAEFEKSVKTWHKMLSGFPVMFLTIFDYFILNPVPVPLPVSPVKIPEIYRNIGKEKENCAILDLPIRYKNVWLGKYLFFQTIHGKCIPYKKNIQMEKEGFSKTLLKNLFIQEIIKCDPYFWRWQRENLSFDPVNDFNVEYELSQKILSIPRFNQKDSPLRKNILKGLQELKEMKFKYIVLHLEPGDNYAINEKSELYDFLVEHAGVPVYKETVPQWKRTILLFKMPE